MFLSFLKTKKIELLISAIYVGIGTLAVCNVAGSDLLYGEWVIYGLLFTLPVTIISFGYRFAEDDYIIPVLIIQFVMFVLTFITVCFVSLIIQAVVKKIKFGLEK